MTLFIFDAIIQVVLPVVQTFPGLRDNRSLLVDYQDIYTLPVWFDTVSGLTNGTELLEDLMTANANNPVWPHLVSDDDSVSQELTEAVNPIYCDNLLRCELFLTDDTHNISRNWMPSDIGTYGVVRGLTAAGTFGPLNFISSLSDAFDFLPGQFLGVEITLKDGVAGNATCWKWAGVPPLAYNFNSSGWAYFGGEWPYYATKPTLPP